MLKYLQNCSRINGVAAVVPKVHMSNGDGEQEHYLKEMLNQWLVSGSSQWIL